MLAFSSGRAMALGTHLSASWSRHICSNWNTMLNTLPSGALYCRARGMSAPQASPTVTRFLPPQVSRFSSRSSSIRRGPLAVIFRSGSLAIWSMTSRRKPSTP